MGRPRNRVARPSLMVRLKLRACQETNRGLIGRLKGRIALHGDYRIEDGSFPMRDTVDESLSRKGVFHLCLVYVLWSTTYLAMRIGVTSANGFPPFVLGALRMPVAAVDPPGHGPPSGTGDEACPFGMVVPGRGRESLVAGGERLDTLGRAVRRFRVLLPHGLVGAHLGDHHRAAPLQEAAHYPVGRLSPRRFCGCRRTQLDFPHGERSDWVLGCARFDTGAPLLGPWLGVPGAAACQSPSAGHIGLSTAHGVFRVFLRLSALR